jgi:hypothetical protein
MNLSFPSFSFLISGGVRAVKRFPLASLTALLAVAGFMLLIEEVNQGVVPELLFTAVLGLPLFIAGEAFARQRGWTYRGRGGLLLGIIFLGLVGYYYYLPDVDSPGFEYIQVPRFLIFLLVAHLLVALLPFEGKYGLKEFWTFNRLLLNNFMLGAFYSAITYLGVFFAIMAVNELFQLHINFKIYAHLFVFTAGVFHTLLFLSQFPEVSRESSSGPEYHVIFSTLCKFILVPIVVLYFFILYTYAAKIVFSWTLPVGWVSSLIIGFSVAGIFTYLLSYYLSEEDDSWLVGVFHRWFWWVVLPMVGLLFVAIGRRIADYGVTEERFLVAHSGVWLLVVSLYFVLSKKDNIKFIPGSLVVFSLVAVLGPLSAFEVSYRSQRWVLRDLLERSGHLRDGKLRPDTIGIDAGLAQRIHSTLDFLDSRQQLDKIRSWMEASQDTFGQGLTGVGVSKWLGIRTIAEQQADIDGEVSSDAVSSYAADIGEFSRMDRVELSSEPRQGSEVAGRWGLGAARPYLYLLNTDTGVAADSFELLAAMKEWRAVTKDGVIDLKRAPVGNRLRGSRGSVLLIVEYLRGDFRGDTLHIREMSGLIFSR